MADTPAQAHDDGNGRVRQADRLARIEEKIDRLLQCYEEGRADRKELHNTDDATEERVQEVETRVTRLEERQGILAGVNAAFTALGVGGVGIWHFITNK